MDVLQGKEARLAGLLQEKEAGLVSPASFRKTAPP
jgi:hypothetical protein